MANKLTPIDTQKVAQDYLSGIPLRDMVVIHKANWYRLQQALIKEIGIVRYKVQSHYNRALGCKGNGRKKSPPIDKAEKCREKCKKDLINIIERLRLGESQSDLCREYGVKNEFMRKSMQKVLGKDGYHQLKCEARTNFNKCNKKHVSSYYKDKQAVIDKVDEQKFSNKIERGKQEILPKRIVWECYDCGAEYEYPITTCTRCSPGGVVVQLEMLDAANMPVGMNEVVTV